MKKLSLQVESLAVESFQTGAVALALAPPTRDIRQCGCASCGGGRCLPPLSADTVECA